MQKKKNDKVLGLTSFDWLVILSIVFAFVCPPAFAPVAVALIVIAILKHLNDIKDKLP
jgi:hypothetical protein